MMADRERVLALINAAWTTQVAAAACELAIPDAMGETAMSATQIATSIGGAPAGGVQRLMRAMACLGLCEESAPGVYRLTCDGALLRSDHPQSLNAWARLSGTQIWRNWGQLAQSIATGRSTRSRLEGTMGFQFLNDDAHAAAVFNRAMIDLTAPVAETAARELDWRDVEYVIDVGGGCGELLATVLRHHPQMRGAVFDLPHSADCAHAWLRQREVDDRAEVLTGSFFDEVPSGADVYLLKSVLHNWNDADALRILERCREAMKPNARLVILERIASADPRQDDRDFARSDLNMLVGCGGRERAESEFRDLLAGARMKLASTHPLAAGISSVTAVRC